MSRALLILLLLAGCGHAPAEPCRRMVTTRDSTWLYGTWVIVVGQRNTCVK